MTSLKVITSPQLFFKMCIGFVLSFLTFYELYRAVTVFLGTIISECVIHSTSFCVC